MACSQQQSSQPLSWTRLRSADRPGCLLQISRPEWPVPDCFLPCPDIPTRVRRSPIPAELTRGSYGEIEVSRKAVDAWCQAWVIPPIRLWVAVGFPSEIEDTRVQPPCLTGRHITLCRRASMSETARHCSAAPSFSPPQATPPLARRSFQPASCCGRMGRRKRLAC